MDDKKSTYLKFKQVEKTRKIRQEKLTMKNEDVDENEEKTFPREYCLTL
jgi:hypothetical protein